MKFKRNILFLLFCLFVANIQAKDLLSKCNSHEISIGLCLQNEILFSIKHSQTLVLQRESYTLNKSLVIYSNSLINGNGATLHLNFKQPNQSAIIGESVVNVSIKNIVIDGSGNFNESMFASPYYSPGSPNAIGFSNTNNGIAIYGVSANIVIDNVKMYNLHHGIYIDAVLNNNYLSRVESVVISNSKFNNIGKAGIFLRNVSHADIVGNSISNVSGNFVSGLMPDLKFTAWADGIYVRGFQDSVIKNNIISSIRRIGIVLEGETSNSGVPITLNKNVMISGNHIYNVYGSKGTEYNAGIWVEPYNNGSDTNYYKTENVIILNNTIDNHLAIKGSHAQWGIRLGAKNNKVISNHILNFNNLGGVGVVYSYGKNMLQTNIFESDTNSIVYGGDNPRNSRLLVE